MAKINSKNGVWVHATALVTIGVPVAHEFEDVTPEERWRVAIKADGEVQLHFVDGRTQRFVVKNGDSVLGVGDHLYLSLQVPPGTPVGALPEEPAPAQGA
ncbi:MAG TPA: hypothetical protein VF712_08875 [Thermoleophilaceae bacterium]|jgi:hypothetical protein